ncbi:MAG: dienelactone hydrolase family protein [Vicinamibacterales bacterium]
MRLASRPIAALVVLVGLAACAPGREVPPAGDGSAGGDAAAAGGAATPVAAAPRAPVASREVSYQHDGTPFTGFVAWDAEARERRPGVLVVHEWWGHDDHARFQARRLAEAGYVGFALDMYGDGKFAEHPDDAQQFSQEVMSREGVALARFNAARAVLAADPHVDPDRIAAIGYCFGGGVVLAVARSGADLDAVATFHGALETNTPAQAGAVKARVLVMTGEADPFVPPAQVEAFRQEMTAAGATFKIITYPGVMHSFTNPNAANHDMPQLRYDRDADRESWQSLLAFLGDVFR